MHCNWAFYSHWLPFSWVWFDFCLTHTHIHTSVYVRAALISTLCPVRRAWLLGTIQLAQWTSSGLMPFLFSLICISIGNQIFQLPAGHTHLYFHKHTRALLLSLSVFLMTDNIIEFVRTKIHSILFSVELLWESYVI